MSASSAPESFEDKIRNISAYLKGNVIVPAQKEGEDIIAAARAEKDRIIAEAKSEADRILREARDKAIHEQNTLESSLRVAVKKGVDTLAAAVEKELLKQSVEQPVAAVFSAEDAVKMIVSEIVDRYLSSNGAGAEIAVSEPLREKIVDFMKSKVAASSGKLAIAGRGIPAGISLIIKDKKMSLEFSAESIMELLAEQLRPEMRKYIFGNR